MLSLKVPHLLWITIGFVCISLPSNTVAENDTKSTVLHNRITRMVVDDKSTCDCDPRGLLENSICETSSICHCKQNVDGERCDQCRPGFWNLRDGNPLGCENCTCNLAGTVEGTHCDAVVGHCQCKEGLIGKDCNECPHNHYRIGDPLRACKPCHCNPIGSTHSTCNPFGGHCQCKETITGHSCDQCKIGFFGFAYSGCQECRCHPVGSRDNICDDKTGQCNCWPNVEGQRCDVCKSGFFDYPRCQQCRCNGHTDKCDPVSGRCIHCEHNREGFNCERCKFGYIGDNCDTCTPSFWGNSSAPGSKCIPCDCHSLGALDNLCRKDDGACNCQPNKTGQKCDQCAPGFWNFPNCQPCQCNGHAETCDSRTGRCIDCKNNTEGFYCETCKHGYFGDALRGSCEPCKCPGNIESGVWHSFGCYSNPTTKSSICQCERGYDGDHCEHCANGWWGNSTSSDGNCTPCDCSQQGSYDNRCDKSTGQCKCLPNVVGKMCDYCAPGYWNYPQCVKCQCSGHSKKCDPSTGVCNDCEHNTIGLNCEFCEHGYYGDARLGLKDSCKPCQCPGTPNSGSFFANLCYTDERTRNPVCRCRRGYIGERCEQCDEGFWGEPTTPGGSCSHCDCDPYGSIGYNCDRKTGQCKCVNTKGGRRCDKCQRGFWGVGCVKCECNDHSDDCDPVNGHCFDCKHNTMGAHCEKCTPGYYRDPVIRSNITCNPCPCPGFPGSGVSHADLCDIDETTGKHVCRCHRGYIGEQCDKCLDGYWGNPTVPGGKCTLCQCNPFGSLNYKCDQKTGDCKCKNTTTGTNCDECQPGFWNFPNCKECDCNGKSDKCDPKTGHCINCKDNTTGAHCDKCPPGHFLDANLTCTSCDCSNLGTDTSDVDICDQITGQCKCLPKIVGRKCNECEPNHWNVEKGCEPCDCDLTGSDGPFCNSTNGQCMCREGFGGLRCNECPPNYFGDPRIECTLCDCNNTKTMTTHCHQNGSCICLKGFGGERCDRCEDGYFTNATEQCLDCGCNKLGSDSSSGFCDKETGNCICLTNRVGEKCDQCTATYWNFNNGCDPCECDEIGSIDVLCDSNNGQCNCKEGFAGLKCNECPPNHFGDPKAECTPCDCKTPGSLSLQCNQNGTCVCHDGVTGDRCEKCAPGYVGIPPDCECAKCEEHQNFNTEQLNKHGATVADMTRTFVDRFFNIIF